MISAPEQYTWCKSSGGVRGRAKRAYLSWAIRRRSNIAMECFLLLKSKSFHLREIQISFCITLDDANVVISLSIAVPTASVVCFKIAHMYRRIL